MGYFEKRNKVDELKIKIDAQGEILPEIKKKINYKFRLDWNYYSNSMEGNTLTIEETRSIMVGNITIGGKPMKDVLEIKGHDKVVSDILKIGKGEVRLSEKRIRDIHTAIMHEEDEAKKSKIGVWKTEPNYIINYKGERHDFVLPSEVSAKMHHLLNNTNAHIDAVINQKEDALHPLDIALQFHLDYVAIHPFYDGNGRTARILTNLLLISFGYPPFWIKENERRIYYQYLADIQSYGGSSELFYEFIMDTLLRSESIVLKAINGDEIDDEEDYIKEIELIKKNLEAIGITKSPNIVKKVFSSVLMDVWKPLSNSLVEFDKLFNEGKTTHFVNHFPEKFEEKNVMNILSPFTRVVSTEPKKELIFGYDIYEDDVKHIEWRHTKYGLLGSNDDRSFIIKLSIGFNTQEYLLKLSLNSTLICDVKKNYNDSSLGDVFVFMDKSLKRHIIEEIKNRTTRE